MGMIQDELNRLHEENNPFYSKDSDLEYMSDMNHWVCVHVTKYDPKPCEEADGALCLKTTAMATGYELPRPTVHFTLNQVVGNHGFGNWDDANIVVLAPYLDVVRKNSNPQEVSSDDTYFIPNPDTGIVLPESTYIIRPMAKSDKLFDIGEHGATYKTEGYTQEEIDEILSLDSYYKSEYEELLRSDFSECRIKSLLGYNEKLIQLYKDTKDKKAFMHGLLEEARYGLLNRLLRDAVVEMSLEKMGYHHVFAHEDEISQKIAQLARNEGIRGDSGNKGHSFSLEHELELEGCILASISKTLKTKSVMEIGDELIHSNHTMCKHLISAIVSDTPVSDVYPLFESVFNDYADRLERYNPYDDAEEAQKHITYAQQLKAGGIKGYNPFLETTLRRHSRRMTLEINHALNELRKNPKDFALLQSMFKADEEFDQLVEKEFDQLVEKAENVPDLPNFIRHAPGGKDDR